MNQNTDNSGSYYAGGILTVIVVAALLTKVLKYVVLEISAVFKALEIAASNFIAMAWQIGIVLSALSVGAASIWAAWYFSVRYYQMIKQGTAIKEQMELRFKELKTEIDMHHSDLSFETSREILQLRQELDKALKTADVTPSQNALEPTSPENIDSEPDESESEDYEEDFESEENEDLNNYSQFQIEVTPRNIHNPY